MDHQCVRSVVAGCRRRSLGDPSRTRQDSRVGVAPVKVAPSGLPSVRPDGPPLTDAPSDAYRQRGPGWVGVVALQFRASANDDRHTLHALKMLYQVVPAGLVVELPVTTGFSGSSGSCARSRSRWRKCPAACGFAVVKGKMSQLVRQDVPTCPPETDRVTRPSVARPASDRGSARRRG